MKEEEVVSVGAFLISTNGTFEGTAEEDNVCEAGSCSLSVTASTDVSCIDFSIGFMPTALSRGELEEVARNLD